MGIKTFIAGVATGLVAAYYYGARLRAASEGAAGASDEKLAKHVRAAIAKIASRPNDLLILADGNTVVLEGKAPGAEIEALLEAVRQVPGVQRVIGQLDVVEEERALAEPVLAYMAVGVDEAGDVGVVGVVIEPDTLEDAEPLDGPDDDSRAGG